MTTRSHSTPASILKITEQTIISGEPAKGPSCSGYCAFCQKEHHLHSGAAKGYCLTLMNLFKKKRRIDLTVPDEKAESHFSTDYLFGEALGQMFGVMVYKSQDGVLGVIPAFSCQYNGRWEIDGWAPPLFDVNQFYKTTFDVEKEIKKLGREIDLLQKGGLEQNRIIQKRKSLSRELMKEIHALYTLTNFKGESVPISRAFSGKNGVPTGTGDCCAPKLLQYAAVNNLTPLGIAEFYWGKENKSKTKYHGQFYPSCREKCAPILGFLLCGLEK